MVQVPAAKAVSTAPVIEQTVPPEATEYVIAPVPSCAVLAKFCVDPTAIEKLADGDKVIVWAALLIVKL